MGAVIDPMLARDEAKLQQLIALLEEKKAKHAELSQELHFCEVSLTRIPLVIAHIESRIELLKKGVCGNVVALKRKPKRGRA